MQIVKTSAEGKAPFMFMEVPRGEHIILVFADEINNGKFDCDMCGFPIEPASMYKPKQDALETNWNDQKFLVHTNITGLVLKLNR